jgi:hypothetical protein
MAVAPEKIPPPAAVEPAPHAKSSGLVAVPDGLPPLTSQTSWAAAGVTPSVRPAPSAIAEPAKKNLVFMVQSPIARAAGECGAVDDNGRPPRRFRVRARNGRLPELMLLPKHNGNQDLDSESCLSYCVQKILFVFTVRHLSLFD